METGLPSVPSRHQMKTEQNTQHVAPKNGCISFQTVALPSDLTCLVRVKEESEPHHSDYLTFPHPEEIKQESVGTNEFIKKEQRDDSSLTLTNEAPHPCDENTPHGLIPPIEMEDDECDVECTANLNTCLNTILSTKSDAAKLNLRDSDTDKKCIRIRKRKARKRTKQRCVKGRDGRTSLKTHPNPDGEEAFWCETCGKEFKRFDLLSNHRREHDRKRPYACEQCGMMFAKPAYLKIHLRRHAGERAFPCDQCDKRFFDKYDLAVHQRDHTGERPYVCRECGKSFKRIYILNKHKKTHSNEKPFECSVCGKAYKYGYSYRSHMKNHST